MRKGLSSGLIGVIVLFLCTSSTSVSVVSSNIKISSFFSTVGDTLYVGGAGPGNYTTIQSAIDNASDGDIIFIYTGIYFETPQVNKSLSIIGEDYEFTIIDGNQSEYNNIFSVNTSSFNLRGVTLQNSLKYGIDLTNIQKQSIITDCYILHTRRAVRVFSSTNITISNFSIQGGLDGIILFNVNNCTISDCKILMDQFGIVISLYSHNNTIMNCEVLCNNESIYGSYGCSTYSDNNRIFNSSFRYCVDGFGISGNKTMIQNCTFKSNLRNGISFNEGEFNTISHCQIESNGYNSPDENGYGIQCFSGSNNQIEECNIFNNSAGGVSFLYWAPNNTLTKSTIERNGYYSADGVGIRSRSSNKIYFNNIISNNIQAEDYHANNMWDNENYGNFWSDYRGYDRDGDAIGDTPYTIQGDANQDTCPLMVPYNSDGISVKITTPRQGFLYFRNIRTIAIAKTILLGNIRITASAADYLHKDAIDRVEFYIDGILRKTDTTPPYNWVWRLSSHSKHQHVVRVIAYDKNGNSTSDELTVWKFL